MGGVCIVLESDRSGWRSLWKTTGRDQARVCVKFERPRLFRASSINQKKRPAEPEASAAIQASIKRSLVPPTALIEVIIPKSESTIYKKFFFFCIFFWRARVCRPLLCLCRPFMIYEGCLDSNPKYCRSKLCCAVYRTEEMFIQRMIV